MRRRYAASLRTLQWINGRPSVSGRALAVATMNRDILVTDLAGTAARPLRVSAANPHWLNAGITSRTVSSSAATSRATAGTGCLTTRPE
jgi:hypothetical protein